MDMEKLLSGDFPFYRFRNLSAYPELMHFVSSGVKNIGFSDRENPEIIQHNRRSLAEAAGFEVERLITARQVHSATVRIVTAEEAGRGALDRESRIPATDALVTNQPGICLMVLSADCVPVLLFEPEKRVVAAVHAGWRGTAANIVVETVRVMQENFGCDPQRVVAAIGPSIGKCCFEVGEEVARVFQQLFPGNQAIVGLGKQPGKYQVDLWEANRKELLACGVKNENICLVNGSSEGIRFIIEAFSSPGGKIVGVVPSYAMYQVYANMYGREFVNILYEDDLTLPVEKIIEKLSEDVELLILLNPNNPIGNVYTNQEFEMILEAAKKYEISILIDEAYMYFYDNTFIDYALNNPHILVTRTFSKLFSLGSLRLGYVVGQPQDVKMISNLCTPHNTNAFAMRFAKAILEKDGMLDMLIKNQLEGKEYIINALKKNGFVVNAKEGNFIFVKPRKVDADIIVERMKQEKKILIKSYSEIGTLGKCLRVTTGEKIYMEKFLEALLDIDK